jgi:ATP phosphoribosyltransferase regulatory subunit
MFLPSGSQDEFGDIVSYRNHVYEIFRNTITQRGFKEISTPIVEYASTFTNKHVGIELQHMLKWFDRNGEIEVLRPDWTSAIARALMKQNSNQKKWAYQGSVFREDQPGIEKRQIGLEIVRMPNLLGESECVFLARELLEKLNIDHYLIELGHTEIFDELTKNMLLNEEESKRLRLAMHNKRKDEVFNFAVQKGYDDLAEELILLIDAFGSIEIIEDYGRRWSENKKLSAIINHFKKCINLLKGVGIENIIVDLGRVKNLPYYSGIMFRGFLQENGALCFSGGRYDQLYQQFGLNVSAVGLAFDVDILANQMKNSVLDERICLIASDETLVYAEKLRDQFQDAIVDIHYELDQLNQYNKVYYIKEINGRYEVIEA